MHLITLTESLARGPYQLHPGSYLADNVNAGELMARHPSTISAQQAPNPSPISDFQLTPGKPQRILTVRAGGFGDLLFLTPVFRHLKSLNPALYISVSCFPDFAVVFQNNPDVDEIVPYPIPLASIETFDAIVPLENTVEFEHEEHAVDCYLREFGLDPTIIPSSEKSCLYHMTDKERNGATSNFPAHLTDKGAVIPRLGVQAVASAMCRTYPHDQLEAVCKMLHARGWEIFFFGEPRTLNIAEAERITNLTLRALTFRQSAAVLATCDVVLAPDSALAHLAGALDVPCVALYGPFPWKLRTAYHPKTIAVPPDQGALRHAYAENCSPCFHHVHGRGHFPQHGPCAKTGRCEVLAAIKPDRVASKISAMYKAAVHIAEHRHDGKIDA